MYFLLFKISTMKFIYTICSLLSIMASCTKHAGDHAEEIPAATLIISQPAPNQVTNKTDSIRITGTATADAIMHGYDVYLTNQNDTTRLLSTTVHDHNTTLVIDTKFAPQATGNYTAHVLLHLDHDGHTLHKSVNFKTQ
jgi:hypothetical protein